MKQEMMNVLVYIIKTRKLRNGECPVLLRVTIDGVYSDIRSLSNSCGKRGHRVNWESPSATHCGTCMPCTYRRASLLSVNDTTTYGNGINKKWAGRRMTPFSLSNQGQDIAAFLEFLRKPITARDIKNELIVGGVTDLSKITEYVNVVLRTREELKNLVNNIGNREVKNKAGLI